MRRFLTVAAIGLLVLQKNAITAPPGAQDWKGPYLKDQPTVPKDPWGTTYVYRYPGTNNPGGYDLYSFGPDLKEGGSDDITNLTTK